MRPVLAYWYEHDEPVVLCRDAKLDAMLDAMRRAPVGHTLAALWAGESTGAGAPEVSHCLRIGVSGPTGSVSYRGLGPDPAAAAREISYSLGDPACLGHVRYLAGLDVEFHFPASSVVRIGLVEGAVREFAATGRRPTCLRWQHFGLPRIPLVSG